MASSHHRHFYLILHDISKRNNIGTLIRSASAFGCAGVLVANAKKRNEVPTFGAHGADNHLKFFFCQDPFEFAKHKLNCQIVGVEILDGAKSVCMEETAFEGTGPVAFVLGNEGAGMHPNVSQRCDTFVYIPHYGGGTASLNVAVAGSIVFHRFASRMGMDERERVGQKFLVATLTPEERMAMNDEEEVLLKRAKRQERKRDAALSELSQE